MGFNHVFRTLREIFPQVDVRLLKAVAIEHSKDADAAVEVILSEILPLTSRQSEGSRVMNNNQDDHHTLTGPNDFSSPSTGEMGNEQHILQNLAEIKASTSAETGSVASETENCQTKASSSYSTFLELLDISSASNKDGSCDTDQLCVNAETKEESSSTGNQGSTSSGSVTDKYAAISGSSDDVILAPTQEFVQLQHAARDSYSSTLDNAVLPCSENTSEGENTSGVSQLDSSAVHGDLADSVEHASASSGSFENTSEEVLCDSESNIQDNSSSTTIVTRSGQICRIDLLEDAIEDAKSNKQTLFSAMETVTNMMKEVELHELEAERCKDDVAMGGLDVLAKVEDLRKMLQHAKEANDMHSGEVYGEKAILATEARELQFRLANLSAERDKSLAVLDEMKLSLEARLAAAEDMKIAAEKEKQETEESARKALAEQELIMEKVFQESKRLQLEAEENSKLRDFLMDRGRVVDTLQGEIAVICQDVKLLKEKFDGRVPLSESLSSSETTCVLASSTSFYKGLPSNWIPLEGEDGDLSPERISPAFSVSDHAEKNSPLKQDISNDDLDVVLDDWEIFGDELKDRKCV